MKLSLHFTVKRLGFTTQMKAALIAIRHQIGKCTLFHCFASREWLIQNQINTEVVDFLDTHFPDQVRFYNEKKQEPMREAMFVALKSGKGKAIFVGPLEGGVDKEYDMAIEQGVGVHMIDPEEMKTIGDIFKKKILPR